MPRSATRRRRPVVASESLQGLGERLRRARAEAGLSQAQLGAPHFTRAYISALELGKIRPAMKSLEFVAAKLGKPLSHFVEDEREERLRRERELDVKEVAALLARPTAARALERAHALLESSSSTSEIAHLRLFAGTALNFLARGSDALSELTLAERIARQLGDDALRRSVMYQTAIAYRLSGEVTRSHDMLNDLLAEIEHSTKPDQILRMKLLKDLGAVSFDLGEVHAATAYFHAALEWAKDIGDIAGLISIYNGLAYAYRAQGDLDAAAGYLQKALGATEVANDLAAAAVLQNALAVLAAERGHLAAAYGHVDRAIEIARVNGPAAYVPHYLNTRTECAVKAGDWELARPSAKEALESATSVGNDRAAAGARVVIADIAIHDGEPEEAARQFEEAAGIYRAIGARSELGDVLMRLSRLAQERGLGDEAQRFATAAYEATKVPSALMRR